MIKKLCYNHVVLVYKLCYVQTRLGALRIKINEYNDKKYLSKKKRQKKVHSYRSGQLITPGKLSLGEITPSRTIPNTESSITTRTRVKITANRNRQNIYITNTLKKKLIQKPLQEYNVECLPVFLYFLINKFATSGDCHPRYSVVCLYPL